MPQWVNVFQDQAIEMLGVTPDEVARKQEMEGNVTECFSNALFHEFILRLRAKMETYNVRFKSNFIFWRVHVTHNYTLREIKKKNTQKTSLLLSLVHIGKTFGIMFF